MTMRSFNDVVAPPALCCDAPPETAPTPEMLSVALDDATVAYVVAVRPAFDALRQVAGQLAGVLVLAAAGGASVPRQPMLASALERWREAAGLIRGLRAPAPGRHYHRHVRGAAACIGRALTEARRFQRHDDAALDAIMPPLRAGYQELQWAAGALPGFEIVAFQHGCCGASHPVVSHPAVSQPVVRGPPGPAFSGIIRAT